jgi:hypothetical protein
MATVKRIWDNNQVVGEVLTSARTKLVVAASIRDGIKFINFREFYQKKSDNTWHPSLSGFCLGLKVPVDHGENLLEPVEPFLGLVGQTLDVLKDMPLYDENNAVYAAPKEK